MRYIMKQDLISFGDDYTINDSQGKRRYIVDGAMFSIGNKLSLQDGFGVEKLRIHEKLVAVRKTYQILREGALVATVKKDLIAPLRDGFAVELEGGAALRVTGSVLDYEYEVSRGEVSVAEISKKVLAIRDSYIIDINDGEDVELLLAVAVSIDLLAHPDKNKDEE